MALPEEEKRMTFTAELWYERLLRQVTEGIFFGAPTDFIDQNCEHKKTNQFNVILISLSNEWSECGNGTLMSKSAPAVARVEESGWKSRVKTGLSSCQLI